MTQQLFYTFGVIFFILLSVLLLIAIIVAIYITREFRRLNRKIHTTMRMFNGILEGGLGYVRSAQLGVTGAFLKRLLRFMRRD